MIPYSSRHECNIPRFKGPIMSSDTVKLDYTTIFWDQQKMIIVSVKIFVTCHLGPRFLYYLVYLVYENAILVVSG